MEKVEKAPQVFLSGGLGNQLFQLAAALQNAPGKVVLNGSLGKPRTRNDGSPDILEYKLPDRVEINSFQNNPFWVKSLSDLLLRASSTHKFKKASVRGFCLRFTSNIAFSLYFRRIIKVILGHGTGYFFTNELKSSNIMFGFYHTYVFPKELEKKEEDLRNIAISNPSSQLIQLTNASKGKKILIVHVRLGDYKSEPALGLLTKEYFTEAIRLAHEKEEFDEIWLFSASPHEAMDYIADEYRLKTKLIEGVLTSPAEILEIMRYGDGYVLSNSTFSWWSAYLSYKNPQTVCVPEPWFRSASAPHLLIPDNWSRVKW